MFQHVLFINQVIITVITVINSDLELLSNWFLASRLEINLRKTNYVIFHPCNSNSSVNVIYRKKIIKMVKSTVYLGLHIDEHLSWNLQIVNIKTKICMFYITKSKKLHLRTYCMESLFYIYLSVLYFSQHYLRFFFYKSKENT